jgi:hypothetical protein
MIKPLFFALTFLLCSTLFHLAQGQTYSHLLEWTYDVPCKTRAWPSKITMWPLGICFTTDNVKGQLYTLIKGVLTEYANCPLNCEIAKCTSVYPLTYGYACGDLSTQYTLGPYNLGKVVGKGALTRTWTNQGCGSSDFSYLTWYSTACGNVANVYGTGYQCLGTGKDQTFGVGVWNGNVTCSGDPTSYTPDVAAPNTNCTSYSFDTKSYRLEGCTDESFMSYGNGTGTGGPGGPGNSGFTMSLSWIAAFFTFMAIFVLNQ